MCKHDRLELHRCFRFACLPNTVPFPSALKKNLPGNVNSTNIDTPLDFWRVFTQRPSLHWMLSWNHSNNNVGKACIYFMFTPYVVVPKNVLTACERDFPFVQFVIVHFTLLFINVSLYLLITISLNCHLKMRAIF